MNIRYPTSYDMEDQGQLHGKIMLFIQSDYSHDASVTLDELIELRCEIDKFLFSRLSDQTSPPK